VSPHSTDPDVAAWLHLSLVPALNPRAQRALLAEFGSPVAAVGAPMAAASAIVGAEAAHALARGPDCALVERTLEWLAQDGHHLVSLADATYPQALLEAGDPPSVLYVQGRCDLLNAPAIAVVGSRNATPQGVRDAEAFAEAFSRAGFCVVSGLALGIDAAAHRGGLKAAGSSIAILGTGADRIYPATNRALAHALAKGGCLVTEYPLGTPAVPGNFPRRNRLISGLARGVLVVEAALESGSLITARLAAEQNREVFAVPGSIHSTLSKGCHALIRQGAKLVECAQDVLSELGHAAVHVEPAPPPLQAATHPLLELIGHEPFSLEQLAQRTGRPAAALAAQFSMLEVQGRIAALPGGWFQRIEGAT
jgi:DNA processing protein